jgi:predicted nuclease with TOPRIM domain
VKIYFLRATVDNKLPMVACMAVTAREAWTDERLDDLKENVNQRFDEVDKRFDRLEGEMGERFDKVDKRFAKLEGEMREGFEMVDKRFEKVDGETKAGFAELHARFDSMQQTIILCFTGMTASIVASVIGAVLLR